LVTDRNGTFRLSQGRHTEDFQQSKIDPNLPNSARVYDWFLGGKDNFAADRALGQAIERLIPANRSMVRENRRFLARAVRYLAGEAGIHQFLDIGTGIPTQGNVHEVAQGITPDAKVVYVDNDPVVLSHARALLVSEWPGVTAYIHADLRAPEAILTDPVLTETLDLNQPVALMLVAILMLLPDEEDPWVISRTLMDALPSGSCVTITHPGLDFDHETMLSFSRLAWENNISLTPRVRADVERFFDGWELIDPGVVPVMDWRPDENPLAGQGHAYYWAGVARKP
jgi:hypothetical protein